LEKKKENLSARVPRGGGSERGKSPISSGRGEKKKRSGEGTLPRKPVDQGKKKVLFKDRDARKALGHKKRLRL